MARIKIVVPATFDFSATIPVRITDINYGGHVGNDTILSIIHEARVQFLKHYNYTEMNVEGIGLIMNDVAIEFKSELFYGDVIITRVAITEISRIGFELVYKLEATREEKMSVVALAKTGMVCYDYQSKKVVSLPAPAKLRLGICKKETANFSQQ